MEMHPLLYPDVEPLSFSKICHRCGARAFNWSKYCVGSIEGCSLSRLPTSHKSMRVETLSRWANKEETASIIQPANEISSEPLSIAPTFQKTSAPPNAKCISYATTGGLIMSLKLGLSRPNLISSVSPTHFRRGNGTTKQCRKRLSQTYIVS